MNNKRKLFIFRLIEKGLNRLKLREKILGLFIFCVIVPIMCTDGFIMHRLILNQREEEYRQAEHKAEVISNLLTEVLSDCERIATSVRVNGNIGEFLGSEYNSPFEYYDSYHNISSNFFFQTLVGFDNTKVKLFTSNESVVNGGYVGKISSVAEENWYKDYIDSGKDTFFVCCIDDYKSALSLKRSIYYMKKLKFINNNYNNFVRIDIDYSTVIRQKLVEIDASTPVYVCDSTDHVLMSNMGLSNSIEFEQMPSDKKIVYKKDIDMYGNMKRIYVCESDRDALSIIKNNAMPIVILLLINFFLPAFVLVEIDNSIINRIRRLDQAFGRRENDKLVLIEEPDGSDEIGNLMVNYNRMAVRVNQLIQIVYKDRIKEQEIIMAKQNAELLALHSQINPHFMFNALESIRMHSVIKGETETAEMVEKLAHMERQYVNWDSDMIEISREMSSVEAYLGLQKYRFGDRLLYNLSVDSRCDNRLIPKLTIVTFVENACVHGMENKNTECWIFVRVNAEDDGIVIEVEDTGHGMSEEMVNTILEKSRSISIDDIKNMKHVGIYNALLRLKMTMGDSYKFDIESEEGVGTIIQIRIPFNS